MEDIKIDSAEVIKAINEALPKVLKDKLASSYDSPISKIVEEEIKGQDGIIRLFVRDLLKTVITDESFKSKIANELIAQIIQYGFKK